jgi:CRP-like cAMP-binding protein
METSQNAALSAFLQRLLIRSALTLEEQQAILSLTGESERVPARIDVVSPGETVETSCLVSKGLVARYDQMLDGQRQVTSYYIAGDMCDLHSVVAPKASWSITAVSQASVIRIPHRQLRGLCLDYPAIALAFWRDGTVDASVFAKWVGNLGRKKAKARIAHIMCEMGTRIEAARLGTRMSFELNVTQEQLSEASGLTPVHVNRTLQEIRRDGLLTFAKGHVEVMDWDALASVAEFDPAFLMLAGPSHRVAAGGRGLESANVH